jgi:hypothetical protein
MALTGVSAVVAGTRRLADDRWRQHGQAGNRNGRSYAITLLTPIRRGEARRLARYLRSLPDDASPLAALPYVHFGRWVVIEDLKRDSAGAPRRRPHLRTEYLLFTADVTAPAHGAYRLPDAFLRDLFLRIPDVVERIWRHCEGYPFAGREQDRIDYLARSLVDTALYYVGYPDATVDDVRHALTVRHRLIDFVRRHQAVRDPAALRLAYLAESEAWFRLS